jgi:hypothetical protein
MMDFMVLLPWLVCTSRLEDSIHVMAAADVDELGGLAVDEVASCGPRQVARYLSATVLHIR